MKLQHGLAILSFLWCVNAHAEQSTSSTGDVAGDLGTVLAAIRAMASIKEICADSFPAYGKQNEAAYLEWRKKYLPFLQEMERYRRDSFMKQVNGNQAEYSERTIWWEKMIETNKQTIRRQFLAVGPENFRQRCQGYSASLQTDRVNLEYFYAEQVATIRKGAKSTLEDGSAAYKRGDYATALRLWHPLALAGDAQAQAALGVMYDNGTGVTQDYQEAAKWYRLAAAKRESQAQSNLGVMYEKGNGVTQDYTEAVKWYRLAAAQGLDTAQNNLGLTYVQGQGMAQDYVRAHVWFNLAAMSGFANAVKGRDLVAARMTAQQIKEAQMMARRCKESNYKQCN